MFKNPRVPKYFTEYQEWCASRLDKSNNRKDYETIYQSNIRLYLATQLNNEIIEFVLATPQNIYSEEPPESELGDVLFYLSLILLSYDIDFSFNFDRISTEYFDVENLLLKAGANIGSHIAKVEFHSADFNGAIIQESAKFILAYIKNYFGNHTNGIKDIIEINKKKLIKRHGNSFNANYYKDKTNGERGV